MGVYIYKYENMKGVFVPKISHLIFLMLHVAKYLVYNESSPGPSSTMPFFIDLEYLLDANEVMNKVEISI